MALSLTLPGISLSLCRSSAYAQIGALEVSLTAAGKGAPLVAASWFEAGGGFTLNAGPLCMDIGRA